MGFITSDFQPGFGHRAGPTIDPADERGGGLMLTESVDAGSVRPRS